MFSIITLFVSGLLPQLEERLLSAFQVELAANVGLRLLVQLVLRFDVDDLARIRPAFASISNSIRNLVFCSEQLIVLRFEIVNNISTFDMLIHEFIEAPVDRLIIVGECVARILIILCLLAPLALAQVFWR